MLQHDDCAAEALLFELVREAYERVWDESMRGEVGASPPTYRLAWRAATVLRRLALPKADRDRWDRVRRDAVFMSYTQAAKVLGLDITSLDDDKLSERFRECVKAWAGGDTARELSALKKARDTLREYLSRE